MSTYLDILITIELISVTTLLNLKLFALSISILSILFSLMAGFFYSKKGHKNDRKKFPYFFIKYLFKFFNKYCVFLFFLFLIVVLFIIAFVYVKLLLSFYNLIILNNVVTFFDINFNFFCFCSNVNYSILFF